MAELQDHYLEAHADELDLYDRLELVRQLAETLRDGLSHRSLAPRNVTLTPRGQGRRARARDGRPPPAS